MENATLARLYDPGTQAKYAVLLRDNENDRRHNVAWVRFVGDNGKALFGTEYRMIPTSYLREF